MFLNSYSQVICHACIDDRLISIRHHVNPVLFHNSFRILMEDCRAILRIARNDIFSRNDIFYSSTMLKCIIFCCYYLGPSTGSIITQVRLFVMGNYRENKEQKTEERSGRLTHNSYIDIHLVGQAPPYTMLTKKRKFAASICRLPRNDDKGAIHRSSVISLTALYDKHYQGKNSFIAHK